jgi:hypothetical protein
MPKKSDQVTAQFPLARPPYYSAMVTTCQQQTGTVQQCSDYQNQPAVQAAVTAVVASAKKLDQTLTSLVNARALVASLEKQREDDAAALRRDHTGMEAAVNVASAGKAPAELSWGAQPATRTPATPTADPPVNPRLVHGPLPGTVWAKCKPQKGAYSYAFQIGTDPTNPSAWPQPVTEGSASHLFSGLTTGQKVYVRIAVLRRGVGQGQWSGVLEIMVR